MRGVSELGAGDHRSDRYGPSHIRQPPPDFVPFAMALGLRALGSSIRYMREAARSPKPSSSTSRWSGRAAPKIDVWQSDPDPDATLRRVWLSTDETRINNDPVQQAYDRLGFFPAPIERKVRGVDLTEEQYETLALMGRTARQRIEAIVARPGRPRRIPRRRVRTE